MSEIIFKQSEIIPSFIPDHSRYRWHVKDYAQLEDLLRVAPARSRGIGPGGILGGKASSRYTGGNNILL